jgi:DNA-nicking Smr family endonuclease
MGPKSKISDDEKTLFRNAMKKVKPLTHQKTKSRPIQKAIERRPIESIESQFTDTDELPPVTGSDYLEFAQPGIQHTLLRKLKSGQYNTEAVLDLHGKTTASAKKALELFLQDCQQHHIKHVLLIHGKGQESKIPVLKNRLNHWLRQSKAVLAFCTAKMKHGHSGALYVLLRTLKKE